MTSLTCHTREKVFLEDPNFRPYWFWVFFLRSKDGKPITANEKYHIDENERKLTVVKTGEEDVGNYTCEATNAKSNVSENRADIIVIGT